THSLSIAREADRAVDAVEDGRRRTSLDAHGEQAAGGTLGTLGRVQHARSVRRRRNGPVTDHGRRHQLDRLALIEAATPHPLHASGRFDPREVSAIRRDGGVDGGTGRRETVDRDASRRASGSGAASSLPPAQDPDAQQRRDPANQEVATLRAWWDLHDGGIVHLAPNLAKIGRDGAHGSVSLCRVPGPASANDTLEAVRPAPAVRP